MKKILSLVAATALFTTAGLAFDPTEDLDLSQAYVGAGVAMESITGYDAGYALVVNAGLPLKELDKGKVAGEVEFTTSLSDASLTYASNTKWETGITTFALYSAYIYDITDVMYVKGRAGFLYENTTDKYGGKTLNTSSSGIAFGVHTGYIVNDNIAVDVGYDFIASNANHITLGAVYSF